MKLSLVILSVYLAAIEARLSTNGDFFFPKRNFCLPNGRDAYATVSVGPLRSFLYQRRGKVEGSCGENCANLCGHQSCHDDMDISSDGNVCICRAQSDNECGANAVCVEDQCECPDGFIGNPLEQCEPKLDPDAQTPSPTVSPTVPPTVSPTVANTTIATVTPTAAPTPGDTTVCSVDLWFECNTADRSMKCSEIQLTDRTCSKGSNVDVVTFSVNDVTCAEDNNNQGNLAFCDDISAIDFSKPIDIECFDADIYHQLPVHPSTVTSAGDTFTVSPFSGSSLPDRIDCLLVSGDVMIQQNILVTSGVVDLDLKDSFGALTLESCDEIVSCLQPVNYTIIVTNIGDAQADVSAADFVFDGSSISVLSNIDPNPMQPTDYNMFDIQRVVDVCGPVTYDASIHVVASPPNGPDCQQYESLSFSTV